MAVQMQVFRIPDLRKEILSYCSTTDKARFYMTSKTLYKLEANLSKSQTLYCLMTDYYSNLRQRYVVKTRTPQTPQIFHIYEDYLFDQHQRFGNFICIAVRTLQELYIQSSNQIGKTFYLTKMLYTITQDDFCQIKGGLDSLICYQCPTKVDAIQCYYNNVDGLEDDLLFRMVHTSFTSKIRKPVKFHDSQKEVLTRACQLLVRLRDRLKFVEQNRVGNIICSSTYKNLVKYYKRYCLHVDKLLTWFQSNKFLE